MTTALASGTRPAQRKKPVFRTPRPEDGVAVWELVRDTPGLDTNSRYFYVLWFRDFADCSLLATVDDEIVGFLLGYRRPEEPDTYFVWQTAVSPRHGIPFLGVKLFEAAADRQRGRGARYVEATVSAENKAILMVLRQYARKRSAEVADRVLFPSAWLGEGHHDEVLHRIGPLDRAPARQAPEQQPAAQQPSAQQPSAPQPSAPQSPVRESAQQKENAA
ncbi:MULTISPECIES: diaminobutyrate acetyltransferase [Streptomyces]|uniref:diaminobutyrate acetyltransferase n=1 Tax=Streptomyces TaxID=1883 RepID=UPI00093CD194|nr:MULTISPECIES: diaminobutyrate acetyltransferase [unclassified Streptomyces]OKJ01066.1 L-2,4-diaminobutyric acid acetyltransferase [Streptomyces sp. TSRI0261]QNQ35729.1 diaminobutyrate acetyltransferase [Streptomyces sp. CB00271]